MLTGLDGASDILIVGLSIKLLVLALNLPGLGRPFLLMLWTSYSSVGVRTGEAGVCGLDMVAGRSMPK